MIGLVIIGMTQAMQLSRCELAQQKTALQTHSQKIRTGR
jgi:hypothetical protein